MRIYCKEIYTEDGCQAGVLCMDHGIITNIDEISDSFDYDASPYRLIPGIIDVHTHGFMTYSSQSTNPEDYQQLSIVMAGQGVTGFLVTAGEHHEAELDGLRAIADAIEQGVTGARILGIHMEGPFLNPAKKGAFMDEQLLPLSLDRLQGYLAAARGHLRYVALAPELDPEGDCIRFLKGQGIRVAGGHTAADYKTFQTAIRYGLDASTHTGNGMSQIDRRDVNALGAALLDKTLYNEIICDFIHIAPEMLQLYMKVKDKRYLMMISDSGQLSGLAPGRYRIHQQIRNIKEDGRILLDDGGIAGSAKSILWGMQCLETKLQIPMMDIIQMSSLNPARFLGIDQQTGSIKVGKDADFTLIDQHYNVIRTYVKGICVYDPTKTTHKVKMRVIERLA